MTFNNEFRSHIKTIINAKRNKLLALFIGAGISKTSDTPSNKLPNWSELIEELKSELNETQELDYLKIAQLYFLTFKEHKYYNTVKKFFPDTIEPSIIHEMIFDLNPEIIITTNWDTILENAIKKQGYLYDIVSSDAELVKSTLPKKLIKMHGDFAHHNFVFKEDDYISYSEHFPLIENYIKGILSTHTVVFLGYSYNDIDVKHIIKWIQSRSECRPPMFLTEFHENPSQKRYLENYGITTLILKEKNKSLQNSCNPYTNMLHRFLDTINAKDFRYKLSTSEDIIQYVYNKIIILNDLNNILFTQIESIFINSKVTFRTGIPLLEFFLDAAFKDKNEEIRDIFRQFIKIIKNMKDKDDPEKIEKNDKLETIFQILNRAGIKGIVINADEDGKIRYINFGLCYESNESGFFDNIIGFNFNETYSDLTDTIIELTNRAFLLYKKEEYDKIISVLDMIIAECRSRRRWTILFIAMLNKNTITHHLKYYLFSHEFDTVKEYNLYEEYEKLPEEIKTVVEPIYDFLQFNDLYKLFFNVSNDLAAKEDTNKTIKSGGIVFGSDGGKNSKQQENLLHFVIGNKIMIEHYSDYQNIHRKILQIRFTEQELGIEIEMNRIELYVAIKYFDKRTLKELFDKWLSDIENKNYKKIIINNDDKKWLVDIVFTNISNQYLNTKNVFSAIETYLLNALFIMSFVNFDEAVINFILSKINDIVSRPGNSTSIYEGIEIFLGLQYSLFSPNFDAKIFIKIIGSIIKKITMREWNSLERYSFTSNGLYNIFSYAKEQKAIFNDEKAVRQIILEISGFNELEKKKVISTILLNIYLIGNDIIKEIIKDFVLGIDNTIDIDYKPEDTENQMNVNGKIIFELNLDIVGLKKIEINVIGKIEEYIKRYEAATYFDGYAVTIIKLIINMYEHKKNDDMEKLYQKAKLLAENKEKMTFSLNKKRKKC
jgi:hypothetical protein